nr:4Fe-4S binding protein [uncultured Rhodoferax sp.]
MPVTANSNRCCAWWTKSKALWSQTSLDLAANKPSFSVLIDASRCTGCGWCVAACPLNLLSLEPQGWKKHAVIHDEATCTGCKKCERRCLFSAIHVTSAH